MRVIEWRIGAALCLALLAGACGGEATEPDDLTPAASIEIGDFPDTLLLGAAQTIHATAFDSTGRQLADRPFDWVSSDAGVLTISQGGLITAIAGGTATITVTSGTATATRTIVARRLQFDSIYPGFEMSCGLESAGEAWCWGAVGSTGTGNGSLERTRSDLPRPAAREYRFASLALGRDFACGMLKAGGVVCWGSNDAGQLGDGSTTARGTPVSVAGLGGATAITAGGRHACALVGTAVRCWGSNDYGQLGDGTRVHRAVPVQTTGLGAATSVTAGDVHTCALSGGEPYCWGNDGSGQLGHDTLYIRTTPARAGVAPGIAPAYADIAAAGDQTCALATDGSAWCWGQAEYPHDFFKIRPAPVRVAPEHQFEGLFNGQTIQCGLKGDGSLWCWGLNLAPMQAPGSVSPVDVAIASSTVCLLDNAGVVRCWDPVHAGSGEPALIGGAPQLLSIAAGSGRFCGVDGSNRLWCWPGWGAWQAGAVTAAEFAPGQPFSSVWDGSTRVCALTATGDAWCGGDSAMEPGAIGLGLIALGSGYGHACGITAAGTAWCWGRNDQGQLGDGTTTDRETPVQVLGGHQFTRITGGYQHTCGLTAASEAYCWGSAWASQMGDGGGMDSPVPVPVDGLPGLSTLAGGSGYFTCGLDPAGTPRCWPVNWQREVRTVTVAAPLVQLTAGSAYACGLDAGGTAWCWGRNFNGAFGNGQQGYDEQWLPQAVGGGHRYSVLSAGGGDITCGITLSGNAWCWGGNFHGAVGSPETVGAGSVALPARVYGQE